MLKHDSWTVECIDKRTAAIAKEIVELYKFDFSESKAYPATEKSPNLKVGKGDEPEDIYGTFHKDYWNTSPIHALGRMDDKGRIQLLDVENIRSENMPGLTNKAIEYRENMRNAELGSSVSNQDRTSFNWTWDDEEREAPWISLSLTNMIVTGHPTQSISWEIQDNGKHDTVKVGAKPNLQDLVNKKNNHRRY